MLARIPISKTAVSHLALPWFGGFPYLITRIVPAFYHLTLLPRELSSGDLRRLARKQVQANQLETCLVLDAALCLYLFPKGKELLADQIPRGGTVITGNLQVCRDFIPSSELTRRTERLRAYIGRYPKERYLLGDLTKGGRPATPEESQQLAGNGLHGVPKGLVQCLTCNEWRGACLDPSPNFTGQIMTVSCRCENDNRCARCEGFLAERNLNANYYTQRDRVIWHYPGFFALGHKCSIQSQGVAGL